MFNAIEKHRNLFKVLLALIALSFVTFGVQSFNATTDNYIAKVGGSELDARKLGELARMTGSTPKEIFDISLQHVYASEGAKRHSGFSPSLASMKTIIGRNEAFQTDGRFDPEKYHLAISRFMGSEKKYLEEVRTEQVYNVYHDAIFGAYGPIPSHPRMRIAAAREGALRDMAWKIYKADDYKSQIGVDENALEAHYKANKEDYRVPEAVKVEYLSISLGDVADMQNASEEEIDEMIASSEGQNSAALAPADEEESDGEVENADGTPAQATATTMSREEAAMAVRSQKAKKVFSAVEEDVAETTFNEPKDLSKVAAKYGVEVKNANDGDWILQDSPFDAMGLSAAIGEELFGEEALQGNNTNVFNDGKTIRVFRNREIRPKSYKPYASVRDEVESDFVKKRSLELIKADAEAAMAKLDKGEDPFTDWAEREGMRPEEIISLFDKETGERVVEIFPAKDDPQYLLGATRNGDVAILGVRGFHIGDFRHDSISRDFVLSWVNRMRLEYAMGFFNHLQQTIPYKKGREKIEDI